MSLLVTGLVLFIAIHLIPSAPRLRAVLVERLGAKPYRGVFSAVVLLSLAAVVWGFSRSPFEEVYAPPAWGHRASMILVPVALVLFAAANMPTRIRAAVRHPMCSGCCCGPSPTFSPTAKYAPSCCSAASHCSRRSGLSAQAARGKGPPKEPVPRLAMDIAAVVGGVIVAGLLAGLHGALFGVPVM